MFIKNLTILMYIDRSSKEYKFQPFSGIYSSVTKINKGNKFKQKTDYYHD